VKKIIFMILNFAFLIYAQSLEKGSSFKINDHFISGYMYYLYNNKEKGCNLLKNSMAQSKEFKGNSLTFTLKKNINSGLYDDISLLGIKATEAFFLISKSTILIANKEFREKLNLYAKNEMNILNDGENLNIKRCLKAISNILEIIYDNDEVFKEDINFIGADAPEKIFDIIKYTVNITVK